MRKPPRCADTIRSTYRSLSRRPPFLPSTHRLRHICVNRASLLDFAFDSPDPTLEAQAQSLVCLETGGNEVGIIRPSTQGLLYADDEDVARCLIKLATLVCSRKVEMKIFFSGLRRIRDPVTKSCELIVCERRIVGYELVYVSVME